MSRTNAELMGHSVPAGGVHAQVRLLWLLRLHARTWHTVRQHLDLQADGTRSRSASGDAAEYGSGTVGCVPEALQGQPPYSAHPHARRVLARPMGRVQEGGGDGGREGGAYCAHRWPCVHLQRTSKVWMDNVANLRGEGGEGTVEAAGGRYSKGWASTGMAVTPGMVARVRCGNTTVVIPLHDGFKR
jgi:hypothetical protein